MTIVWTPTANNSNPDKPPFDRGVTKSNAGSRGKQPPFLHYSLGILSEPRSRNG